MSEVPWAWFVLRSTGLVATGLLTVAVVLGLVGPRLAPIPRLVSIGMHRSASVAGTALIALHVALAVLDGWVALDWPAVLVPGMAGWERGGVALGALAVDLLLVLLVTTATRLRAPRLWRRAHLMAYPAWVLSVGHGLLVGSDADLMRRVALACAGAVLAAAAVRLLVPARRAAARGGEAVVLPVGGAR
jgi:DMSO/TMAO reductase YedYZ heme-binding membrane subunit